MKKNRMRRFVSPALVTIALAVLVAALPIARAMTMPAAEGKTKIQANSSCSVAISAPVNGTDYHLSSNPDTVRMPYDVSWDDQRNAPASRATHSFTLQTEHLSSVVSVSKSVDTYGVASGSDTLWRNVTNVYNGQYVNITFAASVSVTVGGGAGCPASDLFTLSYHYVYP